MRGRSGLVQSLWLFLLLVGCVTEKRVIQGDFFEKGREVDLSYLEEQEKKEKELFQSFMKNPKDPKVAWKIGLYYYANRDWPRAEYWFRYALDLFPDLEKNPFSVRYYYLLANACFSQGKLREAMKFFQKVLSIKQPIKPLEVEFPEYKMSHFYLGLAYFYLGDRAKSDFHFRRYVELGGSPDRIEPAKEAMRISRRIYSTE